MRKLILLVLFSAFLINADLISDALDPSHLPKLLGSSNAGTEFFLTFHPPYSFSSSKNTIKIYVSSEVETEVVLEVPGKGYLKKQKTMPNSVIEFVLAPSVALPYSKNPTDNPLPEQVFIGAAIHISSQDPVIVYGVINYLQTCDGYLAIPLSGLGKEYIVASWPDPVSGTSYSEKFPSFTSIVAPYNKTKAKIIIGGESWTKTAGGKYAGETAEFNMNSGDVVCIGSVSKHGDLTGSKVTGTKLMGVISGSFCAMIPTGVRACDYLIEMELPTNTWGTAYHVTPIFSRTKNSIIRVFSKEDKTQIYRDGHAIGFIPKSGGIHGEGWAEYRATEGAPAPVIISGDKPISVTQYNPGFEDDYTGSQTDPFQMVLTPYEQYQKEIIFSTPGIKGGTGFDKNYINIVYKASEHGTIPDDLQFAEVKNGKFEWRHLNSIDSYPGTEFSTRINNQRYFSKTLKLPHDGLYRIKAKAPLAAYSYGHGYVTAYGFPASVALKDLTINDTLCPAPEWEMDCSGNVEGTVLDMPATASFRSNLSLIYMNTELSYNYKFVCDDFIPGTAKKTDWSLEVIDNLQAARAILMFGDRCGNDSTVMIEYFPTMISVSEDVCNFAKVPIGETKEHTFWVVNNSEYGDLYLDQIKLKFQNQGFEIIGGPTPMYLQPLDSTKLTVRFTATKEGHYEDSIGVGNLCFFEYKTYIEAQVGIPRIDVSYYDFGDVTVGECKYGILVVKNIGSAALEIHDYEGPYLKPVYEVSDWLAFNEFGTDPTYDDPWIINAGVEKIFEVKFTPDKACDFIDSVVFMSNTERPSDAYVDSVAELSGSGIIVDGVSDNFTTNGFKLMPSPVQDILIIQNNGAAINTDKITIIDLSGRTIIVERINILQGRYEINTSSLQNGVYILRIHAGDRVLSEKFSVGR